jgi:hypothetical protein
MPWCQFHIQESYGSSRVVKRFVREIPSVGSIVHVDEVDVKVRTVHLSERYGRSLGYSALVFGLVTHFGSEALGTEFAVD